MSETRIAFVTGGGGGIGRAICSALAGAGHRVAAADLAADAAREVAKSVDGLGVKLAEEGDEVLERAPEPIDRPDRHHVEVTGQRDLGVIADARHGL